MADKIELLTKLNNYRPSPPSTHNNVQRGHSTPEPTQNLKTSRSFADVLKETAADSRTVHSEEQVRAAYPYKGNLNLELPAKPLMFSKHASQRITERGINITPELTSKIDGAIKKAAGKNIKNALILNGDSAFIVNIDSATVITALKDGEMKQNVITNIDGTVIL